MLDKLRGGLGWLLIALLIATPFIAALAPRAMAWWVAVLGLCALPLADREKDSLWILASIPMWIGTLSLCSIMWAAYPDLQFEKAIDRLPMLFGLSIAIIGLGSVQQSIWDKAMPKIAWFFVFAVGVAWLEFSFDFPIFRLYNHIRGMDDARNVIEAVINRGFTSLALLAVPSCWYLWKQGKEKLAVFLVIFTTGMIGVSEASATFLALIVAETIFLLALWQPKFIRGLMMVGGVCIIMLMPFLSVYLFEHMPGWQYMNTPSTGGRLEIWHLVGSMVLQSPLLGYGYEVTRFLTMSPDMIYFKQKILLHPHNAPLQVWVEFGSLGAILASMGWVSWCWKSQSAQSLALAALIAVISILSFGIWQGTWLGLVVFALLYWRAVATSLGNKIQ